MVVVVGVVVLSRRVCFYYYNVCLLEQPLCILKPYFPVSGWTLPDVGKEGINISFASLCALF